MRETLFTKVSGFREQVDLLLPRGGGWRLDMPGPRRGRSLEMRHVILASSVEESTQADGLLLC